MSSQHITQYYLNQAGGGIGNFYSGAQFQKGYGIGSWLGGLFRSILPVIKQGAAVVGREAARAGSHVLADVASGDNLRSSVHRHMGEAAQNLTQRIKRKAEDAMKGSGGIKRRHTTRKPHSSSTPRQKKVNDYMS